MPSRNKSLLFLSILLMVPAFLQAWGFYAHKKMNRMAVFTLPQEMIGFYKENIEYLTEHAVDADKRKYAIDEEAPRHYIDIDHYGEYPFEMVPRQWDKAVKKYTEDTLREYGIIPWHTPRVLSWLTQAFREKDVQSILDLSADIGHYVADAHVPLHTTLNYDGQLTGQEGIHMLWEGRIPELYGETYNYMVGKARYVNKPLGRMWSIVLSSHKKVDTVLSIEKQMRQHYPDDKIYVYADKGARTQKRFSEAYAREYQHRLNNMVERRMRETLHAIGSFWYTAWINAGQPELSNLAEDNG